MTSETPVALVCGGLSSPGSAVVVELLRRGWRVAAQDTIPAADAVAAELAQQTAAAGRLVAFTGDVSDETQRENLVESALEQFSGIDMLVCPPPAGDMIASCDLLELDVQAAAQALSAGLLTPLFMAKRVANEMIRLIESGSADGGKIVFLGSLAAYTTSADQGLACLTASGVAMLCRLFADRLGEFGINVYEVRAGLIATRRGEPGHAKYDELIREGLTPIRRWGRPHDIARAVGAIADDQFGFSTGEVFHIDGGFHLRRL